MPLQTAHQSTDGAVRASSSAAPESPGTGRAPRLGPVIDQARCKGCGLCVEYCPFDRLALDEHVNQSGYHAAVLKDAPPPPATVKGAPPSPAIGEDGALARNAAFWCPRCRYCETVCPDAAILVPGSLAGLEGVRRESP